MKHHFFPRFHFCTACGLHGHFVIHKDGERIEGEEVASFEGLDREVKRLIEEDLVRPCFGWLMRHGVSSNERAKPHRWLPTREANVDHESLGCCHEWVIATTHIPALETPVHRGLPFAV